MIMYMYVANKPYMHGVYESTCALFIVIFTILKIGNACSEVDSNMYRLVYGFLSTIYIIPMSCVYADTIIIIIYIL